MVPATVIPVFHDENDRGDSGYNPGKFEIIETIPFIPHPVPWRDDTTGGRLGLLLTQ
jgi:hypothetical protein